MIPSSTTITDEGRRTRRTLLWLLAGLLSVNAVVWVANSFTSGGAVTGPDGSSYVTSARGSAAMAGMLERLGVEVVQSRLPLDAANLAPNSTLVLIDVAGADFSSSELRRIEEFLEAGGAVVVAGETGMVDRLLSDASQWRTRGGSVAHPASTLLEPGGFSDMRLSGFGSFEVSEADEVILATDNGLAVGIAREVGAGSLAWVADSGPFHNQGIGLGDSAVAVMRLLEPGGVVVFDEFRHGYRENGGLWQIVPANWRLTLGLLAVVGTLTLVAYGRRFGPPNDIRRRLPPGREAYLEAVAGMMTRSGSKADAARVIRDEARTKLRMRSGSSSDHSSGALDPGLDNADALAALGHLDDALMAADAALARLNQERR